jgi:hypothetical protein
MVLRFIIDFFITLGEEISVLFGESTLWSNFGEIFGVSAGVDVGVIAGVTVGVIAGVTVGVDFILEIADLENDVP